MKLLFVLSRFPYPLEKGDKLRAYHQLRILSQQHDIYLFALSDKEIASSSMDALKPYCKDIRVGRINTCSKVFNSFVFFLKGLPIQCGYFFNRKAQKQLQRFVDEVRPDRIFAQLVRTAPYVQPIKIEKTIDYQDAFSQGMWRRAQKSPFWLKPFYLMEYRRLSRYEAAVFHDFQHHTIITETDRELMPVPEKDQIKVVGNGVDFEQFKYTDQERVHDLIFAGNMAYPPNVDAAEFIVNQILPELSTRFPDLRVVLCGANPTAKVRALQGPQVLVTGWVDFIADYYAQSRIFVAPMRLGTGLQNKLLEAMATRLPCVTSLLAAKPLKGAEYQKDVLVCETPGEYADAITRLLTDQAYYDEISQNAYRFVKEHYSWDVMKSLV